MDLKRYLNAVHWLEAGHSIPAWDAKNIRHGFEGLGYELPASGVHVQQVHGIELLQVDSVTSRGLQGTADGLVTHTPQMRIAVKTADCVPLLVYHPEMVMSIHAGWRGLQQDIIGQALALFQHKDLRDCLWGIGPCISLESFEVGPELLEAFSSGAFALSHEELAWSAMKGQKDRWHLDLASMAVLRLRRAGLNPEQISVIRSDTKSRKDLWHSFRRDAAAAGRNWSWIELSV